ncbi:MAG: type II toxin-antitoxin system Phd/YefM family antitoxin [Burkholderiaceae bacterium]|jgi:prevent-host-death family protein|nr:type II toxin-antitoxin system Phd/YefM family antitoxin [Pseudomonadota bacterium]MCO5117345.1 type II toxin-antitoxin system Phd/YefM family antitoxin [Burkholderiaceae bacterium]MCP5216837.1 type II toxin-antitoxin system Phd/YefM family antitoxin [Burkholderiaceae bacterium]
MTTALAASPSAVQALPRTPASDVKKLGWRGVMRAVGREGRVLVTNHDQPEAVILSPDEYQRLVQAAESAQARQQDALQALRQRFDERLAALAADDAGARLLAAFAQPATLDGQVKAGQTH